MKSLDPDKLPFLISQFWRGRYDYVIAGINDDDCSIIKNQDSEIVITSDFLNAKPISVELGIAKNFDLGRLLVASNISDLCGTGAKPLAMMLCTMMDKETLEEDYLKLIEGVRFELEKIDVPLIGGDTKIGNCTSLLGIAIGVKELGTKLFLKNAAKPGDTIWLSGEIGSVSAAIYGLTNFNTQLSYEWKDWAREKLISPNLPIEKSRSIAHLGIGRGGTDLSDGLGSDLLDLCLASGVGCFIDVDKIPVNENVVVLSKISNVPKWCYALLIGGDFQFIVTTSNEHKAKMMNSNFYQIGEITESKACKIKVKRKEFDLPAHGHEDGRRVSFSEEINFLLSNLKSLTR